MSIVRVKHNKENPYVMINRSALWDKELSLEAVGLWARLLSRPDDWKIHASELARSCGCGIKKIYKLLQELIQKGYASREQQMPKGQRGFGKVEYEVYEFKNISTLGHFTESVRTLSVNGETTKEESTKSISISNDISIDEPNRYESREEPDRIGSVGSPSSRDENEKKSPSLEEIEMISDHATTKSEGKIKIKHSDIRAWVRRYGLEKTIQAVDLAIEDIKSGSLLINPPGWITNALKKYV